MLSERTRGPYRYFKLREGELRTAATKNGGRLERHNWWRYHYYTYPYLLLQSDAAIMERFTDVLSNCVDISNEGKLIVTPMMHNEGQFGRLFTELIEETNWRGILTKDAIVTATEQIRSYYANGAPPVVAIDRRNVARNGTPLLKYSKREFVGDMLKYGRFRISPASYYANTTHLRAIKDLETARDYRLKALSDVLEGKSQVTVQGTRIPIVDGVVPLQIMLNDYYLFSTCKEVSLRMPTDFEADAVLVIKDKNDFVQRLRRALSKKLPEWEFIERDVHYFDPYNDAPTGKGQEFYKHLAYAYQKEHRCVLRPPLKGDGPVDLEPFFVDLGALDAIAEIVTL